MMYSTKQMQTTSAASPSPDGLRAQHQGLPSACCCPSALLPAACAGCRRLGLFPGCKTKVLFIPPILCPVHPSQLNSTAPGLGQSILTLGWCWCVFCSVCVCTVCVSTHTHGGRGGSSGPPELPGDAVPMFCLAALCWVPCQNGGSCTFPGRCACPPGWTGRACQTGMSCAAPLQAP